MTTLPRWSFRQVFVISEYILIKANFTLTCAVDNSWDYFFGTRSFKKKYTRNVSFHLRSFDSAMCLIKHPSRRIEAAGRKKFAKTFNGLFQFIISLETDNFCLFKGVSDIITNLRVPILNNHHKFNHFSIFNPITLNWNSLKRSITSTL